MEGGTCGRVRLCVRLCVCDGLKSGRMGGVHAREGNIAVHPTTNGGYQRFEPAASNPDTLPPPITQASNEVGGRKQQATDQRGGVFSGVQAHCNYKYGNPRHLMTFPPPSTD